MKTKQYVVYIGDFDIKNENVQAHLVKNNGEILNQLGYAVVYVGINKGMKDFCKKVEFDDRGNVYYDFPPTLNTKGFFHYSAVRSHMVDMLKQVCEFAEVKYVITYQAPTYSLILKPLIRWCRRNEIPYVVNCADIPVFDVQPFFKRQIMKLNWSYMHHLNRKYSDGVICVSKYIEDFYHRDNRPTVIIPPLYNDQIDFPPETTEDTPVFIYAGTPFVVLDREINPIGMKDRLDRIIDLLLDVMADGVGFKLKILGITDVEYCRCVPRHREALSMTEKIVFYGKQTHDKTLLEICSADYMINYRDQNRMTEAGFSTKVVESISVGTPVVMNAIGDTFDYLCVGQTGFKLTGNHEKDVQLIEDLCSYSKNKRVENKKACYEGKTFAVTAYKDKLAAFFASLNVR